MVTARTLAPGTKCVRKGPVAHRAPARVQQVSAAGYPISAVAGSTVVSARETGFASATRAAPLPLAMHLNLVIANTLVVRCCHVALAQGNKPVVTAAAFAQAPLHGYAMTTVTTAPIVVTSLDALNARQEPPSVGAVPKAISTLLQTTPAAAHGDFNLLGRAAAMRSFQTTIPQIAALVNW